MSLLAKKLREAQRKNKKIVDDHGPPPLTGTPETDFIDTANDAKKDSADIQADSLFSGLTPSLLTPGTGQTMMDWFVEMADFGYDVFQATSPPAADIQQALDGYYTIEQETPDLIATYT